MELRDRLSGLARGVVVGASGPDVSTGAMIALAPRAAEEFAMGNEPPENLHVTLSYLGKAAELSPEQQAQILEAAQGLSMMVPLKARVSGVAHLNGECTVILVDSPELRALQQAVEAEIGTKSTFPGYLPHMTVDYGDELIDVGDLPEEIEFNILRVAIAGENTDFDGLAITAGLFDTVRKVAGKVWDEAMHPRARDGQWIEKDGFVRGTISFRTKGGGSEVRENALAKVVDFRNGIVHVEDTTGARGVASPKTIDTASPPKARVPGTSWSGRSAHQPATKKPAPPPLTPEQRREQAIKAMANDAAKLTDDPEQRIPVLNKIMGGLRGSPLTTIYEHNKQGPSGDEWSDDRIAQQEELWDEILEKIEAVGVPRERRALVLGGPPGAGKSFSLKPGEPAGQLGVVGWDLTEDPPEGVTHVVMNPDVLKELMIEKGMMPDWLPDEIRPREAASITHAESNFLTMLFMSRLAALDINTVYDSTMANREHVQKNIRALAEAGYQFQGLYVKIPKQESAASARKRFIAESVGDPDLGGRFVPTEASSAWDTESTFKQFQSWFTDGWLMVDNTGLAEGKPRKETYAEGTGNGRELAYFLSPMPPPEHRPKRPPIRAGDPKQRSFWEPSGIPSVIEPYKKAEKKPVMWKPGMKLDEEGNVLLAAGAHYLPLYTDTQAALGMHAGVLSPDEFLELLRQNLVLVSPEVVEEEDYLAAPTVFHEITRLGRGGITMEVGDEYNRLRSEGLVRDTYTALTAGVWDPLLHPRGKDGKFIRVNGWIRGKFRNLDTGKSTGEINAKVSHFKPSGDPTKPHVVVDTPDGPAIANVSRVETVASPKASLAVSQLQADIGVKRAEFQALLPEGKSFGEFNIKTLYGPTRTTLSPQIAALEAKSTEMGSLVDDEVMKRLEDKGYSLIASAEEFEQRAEALKAKQQAALEAMHVITNKFWAEIDPDMVDVNKLAKAAKKAKETPEGAALQKEMKKLADEAESLHNNRHIYRSAYSKVLREVLGELVDGGLGGPMKVKYHKGGGKEHQAVMAETVEAVYPSSWIAASNNYDIPVSINVDPKRAQYSPSTGQMRVYPAEMSNAGQAAVHEFGHRMEEVIPGLKPLEFAFYWRRVGNEPKFAMAPGEYTRADEFPTAYMGKDYGAGMLSNFELFTVAAEDLLSPKVGKGTYGVNGLLKDKDYRSWFLGTLIALTGPEAKTSKNLTLEDDIVPDEPILLDWKPTPQSMGEGVEAKIGGYSVLIEPRADGTYHWTIWPAANFDSPKPIEKGVTDDLDLSKESAAQAVTKLLDGLLGMEQT